MNHRYMLLLAAGLLAGAGCTSPSSDTTGEATAKSATDQPPVVVRPTELPNPGITNFRFPEDSTTIERWIQRGDSTAIARHSWGIWQALTASLQQLPNGDTLRVYETWKTKQELGLDLLKQPTAQQAVTLTTQERPLVRSLARPRQFFRDAHLRQLMSSTTPTFADSTVESVSYNPVAAQTILNRRLFQGGTLQKMLAAGQKNIPDFPNSAIAIKPVYEIVPGPGRTSKAYRGLYRMKVWANIPDSLKTKPSAYGQNKWNSWVYVDGLNRGRGQGQVARQGQPLTDSARVTYNVRDFVHYTLTKKQARLLDSTQTVVGAQGGDIAVLVAMHITTREIKRWTWQTVWWAPNPVQAPAPTTPGVIATKPAQLKGAPRHYALAVAYQMLSPVQPLTGGNNRGRSIYVFNPYLEAAFGPFGEVATVLTGGVLVTNNVGMRTNCMSCHAQANYALPGANNPGYIGNTYVDYKAAKFQKVLKTDFLWSIPDMASGLDSAAGQSTAQVAGRPKR